MILVFKTTVTTREEIKKLKVHLDELLFNSKWNFDLEDCDNILRVDGPEKMEDHIINLLNRLGFDCMELV